MTTLIAGRFSQQTHAETASAELLRSGFSARNMTLFYVNPQGQHDIYPIGGDVDESAGTHEAGSGAIQGAAGGGGMGALVGAATLPVLGPLGPILGAAVGAYTGSLVGALNKLKKSEDHSDGSEGEQNINPPNEPIARKAGVLLAVAVETPEQRENAIQILRTSALEIEEAEGTMSNGEWTDFNPSKPIKIAQ